MNDHEPDSPNWVRSHEHFENEPERDASVKMLGRVLIVVSTVIIIGLVTLVLLPN